MLNRIWPIAINILYFLVIIAILSFLWTGFDTKKSTGSISSVVTDTAYTIHNAPEDTVRMTYKEFSALENKKQQQQQLQKELNQGGFQSGTSFSSGFMGFQTNRPLSYIPGEASSGEDRLSYYITLPGYRLDRHMTFTVRDGKYWLRSIVWDSTGKNDIKHGHSVEHQVPFRFAYKRTHDDIIDNTGSIMIPVSKKAYNTYSISFGVLYIILLFALGYIFFVIPVKMLIRISRGEVFTRRHVRQLNLISIVLLAVPVLTLLMQLIMKLVFHKFIGDEIALDIAGTLTNYQALIASVIFFAIAKAFKRGLSLQNEQDLTI